MKNLETENELNRKNLWRDADKLRNHFTGEEIQNQNSFLEGAKSLETNQLVEFMIARQSDATLTFSQFIKNNNLI